MHALFSNCITIYDYKREHVLHNDQSIAYEVKFTILIGLNIVSKIDWFWSDSCIDALTNQIGKLLQYKCFVLELFHLGIMAETGLK